MIPDRPLSLVVSSIGILLDAGDNAEIYQNTCCRKCNHRQTHAEPNVVYAWMRCERCGEVTAVVECGYMVIMGGSRETH